ncbi:MULTISPECIES: beta-phosphoglucomutase family hydrolase [Sorangium]|uniref:Beta-phosphoglucomutase n=1 Tax=Sorangium cellulosum TaxID=56 RepID=A0A4P2QKM4_SORCE|nr:MULTISPECIES: beta-phosphoglucomutase family hydrolase [Sorangium]AUX30306.1 uncharacterized protein SOCE836_024060 [Sorangium cellulosum]WCQ89700.1 HAD-superfamily hydrolase [Sorangium sp. Soce836]
MTNKSHAFPSVYLARHGETAWTTSGRHTGMADLPLTSRGERNARRLDERLGAQRFAKVFTSPLRRALRTCELAGFGALAIVDQDLVEWNYGEYEGKTPSEIEEQRPGWEIFGDGCPGGESAADVARRADRVVERLRAIDSDVLLFSHSHFLRIFTARWLGLSPTMGRYLLLDTAALSIVGYHYGRQDPVIRLWNDCRHASDGEEEKPGMATHLPDGRATLPAGVLKPARFDAVLFDLDGVLTSTARVHAAAWKQMFDDYLRSRSLLTGEAFRPFDLNADYKQYVDGKPRYDGVRSFLASRAIALPEGTPASPPDEQSVCGLGNRKDELVKQAIHDGRVHTYPGAIAMVRWVRRLGLKVAVVSSSRNCAEILRATGIEELFDARVDGEVVEQLHLPGKPAPDTYLWAAERLDAAPSRAVVVEDAIAGVQAGRAGGFGLVVGVDRGGSAEMLRKNGADLVVTDLGELVGEHER